MSEECDGWFHKWVVGKKHSSSRALDHGDESPGNRVPAKVRGRLGHCPSKDSGGGRRLSGPVSWENLAAQIALSEAEQSRQWPGEKGRVNNLSQAGGKTRGRIALDFAKNSPSCSRKIPRQCESGHLGPMNTFYSRSSLGRLSSSSLLPKLHRLPWHANHYDAETQ